MTDQKIPKQVKKVLPASRKEDKKTYYQTGSREVNNLESKCGDAENTTERPNG